MQQLQWAMQSLNLEQIGKSLFTKLKFQMMASIMYIQSLLPYILFDTVFSLSLTCIFVINFVRYWFAASVNIYVIFIFKFSSLKSLGYLIQLGTKHLQVKALHEKQFPLPIIGNSRGNSGGNSKDRMRCSKNLLLQRHLTSFIKYIFICNF